MENQNVKTQLQLPPELSDIQLFHSWEATPVTCEADVETAGEYIDTIGKHLKAVKLKQDELFGPLKRAIRDFEVKVKDSVTDPLKKIELSLRGKVQVYWNAEQQRKDAEEKQRREEAAAKLKAEAEQNMETAMETGSSVAAETAARQIRLVEKLETAPVDVKQTVRTSTFTMAQNKIWTWKVTNESLVPRGWLILDEKKLNAVAKTFEKAPLEVPGIEFYQESRVSMRR